MMSDVKMKRIAEFLRGVGGIGDDLIAEASEEELKGHTIRRRVSFRGVCGGIAACLVLAAAVFVFPLLMDGNNGGNADGAPTESCPLTGSAIPARQRAPRIPRRMGFTRSTYTASE